MLEGLEHAEKSFVTLTYSEDRRDLVPEHLSGWLKRIRFAVSPKKLRFFGVGEYGDISFRPHYHVALYGHPPCQSVTKVRGDCPCPACSVVRSTWGYGHVMVGRLEEKSASYIAGYCMKKMTHNSDIRLGGRNPEFTRMSLRPGIGATAMHDVASEILRWKLGDKDVPIGLRHGGKVFPLGKYLRRRLRVLTGKVENAPPGTLQTLANQMQLLRAYAWQNDRSVSSVFEELFAPVEAQIAGRLKLKERPL